MRKASGRSRKSRLPGIKTVAVLVNMPVEEAAALANTGIADLLQLHGDEDAAYIAKLKTLTRAKIIKAIRLRSGDPEANAKLLTEAAQADYYLFDTFVADTYGGTGKTFSLSLSDRSGSGRLLPV